MITQGISGLDLSNFDSICMGVLKKDVEQYNLRDAISKSFKEFDIKFTLLELDELRHIVIVKRRINYFKYFLFFLLIIILFPQTQKRVYKTIKFW